MIEEYGDIRNEFFLYRIAMKRLHFMDHWIEPCSIRIPKLEQIIFVGNLEPDHDSSSGFWENQNKYFPFVL